MASSDPLNPVTFLTFLENIPASSNAFTATADHITDLRKVCKYDFFDPVVIPLLILSIISRLSFLQLLYHDGGEIWYASCFAPTYCKFGLPGIKTAYDVTLGQCLTSRMSVYVY